MKNSSERVLSITEVLNILFKNKWLIVGVFSIAVLLALAYVLVKSPVYVAETKLMVKLGREKLSPLSVLPNTPYNIVIRERPENIQDEIEIITNPILTYKVIPILKEKLDELTKQEKKGRSIVSTVRTLIHSIISWLKDIPYKIGLKKRESETKRLFRAFRQALVVNWQEESNVIQLGFKWSNPEFAAFAANVYAKAYLDYRERINKSQQSVAFYEDQIKTYKNLLGKIENEIRDFQEKHGIAAVERQKDILLNQRADLEKRLQNIRLKLPQISLKKSSINRLLSSGTEWIETPQIGYLGVKFTDLAPLDKKYFELKAALNEALQIFTPESREVKSIKEQIQKLRKQKAESLINILSIEEANLKSLQSEIEQQLEEINKKLTKLVDLQLRYQQLQRMRKIYEDNFLLYSKKAEELRITGEMDKWKIASVQIINPASPPLDPVWPKKKLILLVVAVVSFFMGIILAFLREMFSVTIDRGGDLEKLGIKHIITIPDIEFLRDK